MGAESPLIVLYDGVCILCSRTVRFILRRDPSGRFRFAALQSPSGREQLERRGLPADRFDSIVVLDGDAAWTRSNAFIAIVSRLRAPWPLLRCLRAIPRSWRDAGYDFVARRRYRWFGRREACDLPPADFRSRFL